MSMKRPAVVRLGCASMLVVALGAAGGPPATEKRPVTDEYHATKVTDDYRWLERWDDPQVKAWSDAQGAYARTMLDAMPGVAAIRARVSHFYGAGAFYWNVTPRAGRLLAMKMAPPRDQPALVLLDGSDAVAPERVVFDPLALDPKGGTSIDWYEPSPDGRLVAISLSKGGSERGDVHVYEVGTGKPAGEVIPGVNGGTAGGSLAWTKDGTGFYYTRYPRAGERPAVDLDFFTQVYFHTLGTPTAGDRYEIGRDFPRIAEIHLETSDGGQFVLANVANGDGGEFAQFVRRPNGEWTQLTTFADKIVTAVFGPGRLYLLSRQGAPNGQLLSLPLSPETPPAMGQSRVVVPECADAVIAFSFGGADTIVATDRQLFVVDLIGGPNQVRVFTPDGVAQGTLKLPNVAGVGGLVPLGDGTLAVEVYTFTQPTTWYRFRPGDAADAARLAMSSVSPADFSDVEVVREQAVSKDGTRVPLTILRRRGTALDGRNPTLLTGYGGYGVSLGPFFDPVIRVWLDHGGVMAVANLRGGGEFGERWHEAGNLTRKQNVFDDFIACAEHLIRTKHTSREHLAIEGGSNGGLLMGAVMTERPELFRAVVSHVGIYDMLRVELSPNGAFNVPEFGTVKDAAQFRAMYAYSPYHHVKNGVSYPATLLMTGANDPRVDPMHSRKMAARLQAATAGPGPVLLRTSAGSGHGIGTSLSEAIEQQVDVYAFLFHELGMKP
jgi:prolyl oligopeptidase